MVDIKLNIIYRFGFSYVMYDRSVQIQTFLLFYQQYQSKLDGRSGVYNNL